MDIKDREENIMRKTRCCECDVLIEFAGNTRADVLLNELCPRCALAQRARDDARLQQREE